ncbi:hypothetical protein [Nocardiopsis deserti]|uniref:hypothetical protein n=1 Tax=Nocardiopsis deserti TaxID=2605988 RepID=UPI00123A8324|nr:hypothetical protein [Nocardiopsis deserti]
MEVRLGDGLGNDFVRDYRILHDNGHNVLAFDFRNCGLSAAANGGMASKPTLTYGVHDDPLVRPSDREGVFEAMGAGDGGRALDE